MKGDITLGAPSLKMATVAKAKPIITKRIGKIVSTARVFLSLICIKIFFFVNAPKCKKNTLVSASSEIVYSSSAEY